MAFTFSLLDQNYPLWSDLVHKINFQFKLKYNTYSNLNMQNSLVVLNFSVLDQKYPFWANLVQKMQVVSLS